MKIAIIHEWMTKIGGAEKVGKVFSDIFPDADLFALVADKEFLKNMGLEEKKITTSIIQKLPFGKSKYKAYLPFYPFAVEQFDLRSYDLIISSSHAVSKGVLTNNDQLHITYCHSPIRYAWDLYHQYLEDDGLMFGIKGLMARYFLHRIRMWDWQSSKRPDYFVSNSNFIGKRIKKVYDRDSITIYPPIEVDDFTLEENKGDYYVTSSRMVAYKKIDLIVEAFSGMPERKLIVIGDGPEFNKIKNKGGSNITFKGSLPFNDLVSYLQKAKAFVFASMEDFGMSPVEAQACGTPVIAYGKGGSLETVKDGVTGVFFYDQTVSAIVNAVERFETLSLEPIKIRKHAENFGTERFKNEFLSFVLEKLKIIRPDLNLK